MRWIARIIFILLLSSPLWGQHTTVTATVLDPNGTPYVNCTGSANFVGQNNTPGSGPYTLGGGAFQTVVPIFCDSFGKFTVSLASNNVVTPTPSQWNFQITSATGYVPGNTYSFNTLITITGATQDVGSLLTSVAPVLPVPGGGPSIPLWNTILPPIASLSLNMGLNTTSFTFGDAGSSPKNFWSMLDSSTSSTDTSVNFSLGTGNNSYHQPLSVAVTTGGSTFPQLQVCNLGTGHVGVTVVGNILPCLPSGSYLGLPGNTGVSGVAKLTVMDNSASRTQLRLWQNNISSGSDQFQINTAGVYNASTNPFNFLTACSGGTQFVSGVSFGNGLCGGSNPGTILATLRGDGTFFAANYIGPVNSVNFGSAAAATVGYVCALTTTTSCTWQAQAGGGGGGGTGSQYQSAFFSATNAVGGYGPGTPGQIATSRGSGAGPVMATQGVGGGNSGTGIVSTNTYTIACDDPTLGVLDRLTTILFTFSGTVSVTLPPPSTTGCGNNFTVGIAASTGTTVNVTSSATFTTLDGNSIGSTVSLTAGQYATVSSPDNIGYLVRKVYGLGSSIIISGTLDGKAPVTLTTGTTASLGSTFSSGYTFNQEATAAASVTYTLPTAAAGRQYCVSNSYNGSAATTGALTIQTSAAGQFIIWIDGTLTASGGFVLSSGAAGDAACVVGLDATHWQIYIQRGSFTKH